VNDRKLRPRESPRRARRESATKATTSTKRISQGGHEAHEKDQPRRPRRARRGSATKATTSTKKISHEDHEEHEEGQPRKPRRARRGSATKATKSKKRISHEDHDEHEEGQPRSRRPKRYPTQSNSSFDFGGGPFRGAAEGVAARCAGRCRTVGEFSQISCERLFTDPSELLHLRRRWRTASCQTAANSPARIRRGTIPEPGR
jgi:hypothetical protein